MRAQYRNRPRDPLHPWCARCTPGVRGERVGRHRRVRERSHRGGDRGLRAEPDRPDDQLLRHHLVDLADLELLRPDDRPDDLVPQHDHDDRPDDLVPQHDHDDRPDHDPPSSATHDASGSPVNTENG